MGISTVTAGRILKGQREGQSGEEYRLSFEKFPYVALAKVGTRRPLVFLPLHECVPSTPQGGSVTVRRWGGVFRYLFRSCYADNTDFSSVG